MSDKVEDFIEVRKINNDIEIISNSSHSMSTEDLPEVLKKFLGDISRKSVYQQVGVGALSGVVAGALLSRVGKMAAIVVGGSILVLQVGIHQGIIKVDWCKLENVKKSVKSEANRKFPKFMQKMKSVVLENRTFMMSFTGGFLTGFLYL